MSFTDLGVSMGTKLLSDKIGGILEGIFDAMSDASIPPYLARRS
jgi:hypothetical protein